MAGAERLAAEGLDLLDVGVALFDRESRLVHANSAFRSLRDYPDDVCCEGVTLESLLRFNADRGDFGPGDPATHVAERLAEITHSENREIEREMADGQILAIRYRRTGGGGLLVTFEDRTDQRKAEAARRASEERYALVAEAAEEAIYEWNIAEERFFASPRLTALLGRATEETGERDWRWNDLIHPDDLPEYERRLEAHLNGTQERWSCEYRLRGARGAWRWVSDHGTSIRNEDGRAIRMIAAIRDITDRVTREAALAASEERHTLVSQATSDGIYDWNVADDVLYVSDNLTRILDFELDIKASSMWAERVHPEDFDQYVAAIRAHFRGETEALECDYRVRGTGGDYRWIQDRGIGVRNDQGRVTRMVGAVRDITEIREARAERDRIESRMISSLATISDGILLLDPESRVQLWNDRYLEIFTESVGGADLTKVITQGRPFADMIRDGYNLGMFKPHPDGVDHWVAERMKAWNAPESQWELELANGHWILLNERQMPDGGRVSVYTDITELKRREQEADAARARFEEAIEAISSGFVLWDAKDNLVVCNSRYRKYFLGLADVVTPGTNLRTVLRAAHERGLFPDAQDDVDAFVDAIMAQRASGAGEAREQHLAGDTWLQITDHRTKDGGLVSIYTDVTELKTKQAEIEAQSAILMATLENMGQGITMVDNDLKVVAFNRRFLQLMDWPEDRFGLGFTMEEAFRFNAERGEYGPGDVEEQVRERVELARKFLPHQFERSRPDGTVIEIIGNPIEAGGLVATYTDITERKRSDEALKAALAEFNAVIDSIDYGIIFMGPDLHTRIVNRAFRELWGIPEDFVGDHPHMRDLIEFNRHNGVYDVAPEDWEDWIEMRVAEVLEGDIPPGEFHRADGKVFSYQCVALPDGGRMLTYFDITEMKAREAAITSARDAAQSALADLQKAQERLVQAEKMASLGQLTAGIAHEIKNPLNFVNNFANLSNEMLVELSEILEGPIKALDHETRDDAEDLMATIRENLGKINEHGRRADSIVKNMLLHSREGPSQRQMAHVNTIAEEALNLAYHGARAENPNFNVAMTRELDPGLGQIDCFPQDLMRVFLNLIGNGMYAAHQRADNEGDGFKPEVTLISRAVNGNVEIEVRDNGAGIAPDVREKIFEPFFTTKPAGEGTGLGLSLSYDIVVKRHGGELSVESKPGEFTAFRVVLPEALLQASAKTP